MKLLSRLICTASVVLAVLAPAAALADPSIIYLVRHGEKELNGKDPELTAAGHARAQDIATTLQKTGIGAVYSIPAVSRAIGSVRNQGPELVKPVRPQPV